MKTLTVVRHAHAENARPGADDTDRALSRRGQKEATLAATTFAARNPDVDLLLASPARRARATAEAFAQALGFEARAIEYDERLYLAGADTLFVVVQALDGSLRHVVLIGHNPGMSEFVRALTGDEVARELRTAEARSCRCDISNWEDLAERCGAPADDQRTRSC